MPFSQGKFDAYFTSVGSPPYCNVTVKVFVQEMISIAICSLHVPLAGIRHMSAKLQSPPLSVPFFCSCDNI